VFGDDGKDEVLRMTSPAVSVAFTPDGTRLAAGLKDGSVAMWPLALGQASIRLPIREAVSFVSISPRDPWMFTTGKDDTMRVFDISVPSTARQIQAFRLGANLVRPTVSPDGRFVVIPDSNGIDVVRTHPWMSLGHQNGMGEVKLARF